MFSLKTEFLGRLFWKLFFAIWLSQLTAVIGVGMVFWLHQSAGSMDHLSANARCGGPALSIPISPEHPLGADGPFLPVLPMAMGFISSLFFSAVLAWYFAKPIRYLRAGFACLANNQHDTQVTLAIGQRHDELADLGREFDRMAHQITTLMAAQRHLLHDVSHELRSPLARLQAAIGLARQQPDKIDTSLDRIEREAGRLDELVSEVLTLSRLEAGVTHKKKEEFDLTELLESVIEDVRFEAAAKNVAFEYIQCDETPINADAELIHRALENILRNALKHTPPEKRIQLEMTSLEDSKQVSIRVSDQGPGVSDDQLPSIFEPFFRGNGNSQTGFGLGLAIARRALEVHGGSITARNKPGGGLQLEMVLPTGLA